jgi:hypothetical protein
MCWKCWCCRCCCCEDEDPDVVNARERSKQIDQANIRGFKARKTDDGRTIEPGKELASVPPKSFFASQPGDLHRQSDPDCFKRRQQSVGAFTRPVLAPLSPQECCR